jgi:hypothetical protein
LFVSLLLLAEGEPWVAPLGRVGRTRVIAVTDRLELGGERFASRTELLAAVRRLAKDRGQPPLADVLLLPQDEDPQAFFEVARRLNLSLSDSLLLGATGERWPHAVQAALQGRAA